MRRAAIEMFWAVYFRLKRCWRRIAFSTPPTVILFETRGQRMAGNPLRVAGYTIVVQCGKSARSISYPEAIDKRAFLAAWYTLGGGSARTQDGTPLDPDDVV